MIMSFIMDMDKPCEGVETRTSLSFSETECLSQTAVDRLGRHEPVQAGKKGCVFADRLT